MIDGTLLVVSSALKKSATRTMPPPASTTPVAEKSSNQPISSGVYGRPKPMIGAESFSALVIVGKAPSTLPTDFGPAPKSGLRFFLSSAADATGGKVSSRL